MNNKITIISVIICNIAAGLLTFKFHAEYGVPVEKIIAVIFALVCNTFCNTMMSATIKVIAEQEKKNGVV